MPTTKETEELNQTHVVNELEEGVENIASTVKKEAEKEATATSSPPPTTMSDFQNIFTFLKHLLSKKTSKDELKKIEQSNEKTRFYEKLKKLRVDNDSESEVEKDKELWEKITKRNEGPKEQRTWKNLLSKKKQEEENLNGVRNAEFVRYLEINHPKENSFLDVDDLEKREEFRKEFEEKRENLRNAQQCLDFFYPLEKRKKIIKLDIDDWELDGYLKLQGFTNLKDLDCSNNMITELDLSDCFKLIKLNCGYNRLTDLNSFLTIPCPHKLIHLNVRSNNFSFISFPLHIFPSIKTVYQGDIDDDIWHRNILKSSLEIGGGLYRRIVRFQSAKFSSEWALWTYRVIISKTPTFVGGALVIKDHPIIGSGVALGWSGLELFFTPWIEGKIKEWFDNKQIKLKEDVKNWNDFLDNLKKEEKRVRIELAKLGFEIIINKDESKKNAKSSKIIELVDKVESEKIKKENLDLIKGFLKVVSELPRVVDIELKVDNENDKKTEDFTRRFNSFRKETRGQNVGQAIKNLYIEREMDEISNEKMEKEWKNQLGSNSLKTWRKSGLTKYELGLASWLIDKKKIIPQLLEGNDDYLEELRVEYLSHLESKKELEEHLKKSDNLLFEEKEIKKLISLHLAEQDFEFCCWLKDNVEQIDALTPLTLEEKFKEYKQTKGEENIDIPSMDPNLNELDLENLLERIYKLAKKHQDRDRSLREFVQKHLGEDLNELAKSLEKIERRVEQIEVFPK